MPYLREMDATLLIGDVKTKNTKLLSSKFAKNKVAKETVGDLTEEKTQCNFGDDEEVNIIEFFASQKFVYKEDSMRAG